MAYPGGDPSPGVRVALIICGSVVLVALIAAVVYVNAQGRDATALYALAAAIAAGVFPGVLASVRVERLRRRVDAELPERHQDDGSR